MAGLGKTTFVAGTILTASQVNGYLMDQAVQVYAGTAARGSAIAGSTSEGMMTYLADTNSVQMATGTATFVNVDSLPIVAGTATRDALYPVPTMGNTVFRTDTGNAESYFSTGRDATGWYSTTAGLIPIVPTSVTATGGTATVNSITGTITMGTGMTGITFNGVFTSTYKKYMVVVDVLKNAVASNTAILAQMSVSGTPVTSGYVCANIGIASSNAGIQNLATANAFYLTRTYQASRRSHSEGIFVNPQNTAPTLYSGTGYGTTLGDDQGIFSSGTLSNNTSYSDLRLVQSSDSFSGTVNIYGLRD
jgi:hypothetical protein